MAVEQVRAAILGEERPPEPTLNQRMSTLRAQIYEMCGKRREWAAMPQARSQAMHYMEGSRGRRPAALLLDAGAFYRCGHIDRAVYKLQ